MRQLIALPVVAQLAALIPGPPAHAAVPDTTVDAAQRLYGTAAAQATRSTFEARGFI
ncbi:hypothetical protein GCM10010399_61080 [Dactylosporangium fulvum]|uniref:Uncharacterized protein n=1 Tax=Dactylosporangium fulvum TaxID=53359 RepID=A0ABY5W020_9ACTN|nr:hypothetical protein [Dactylosporangium fulvum]UWP83275.1 hypothetical protein Dfulv_02930 [Dactylosporangium fulvum]